VTCRLPVSGRRRTDSRDARESETHCLVDDQSLTIDAERWRGRLSSEFLRISPRGLNQNRESNDRELRPALEFMMASAPAAGAFLAGPQQGWAYLARSRCWRLTRDSSRDVDLNPRGVRRPPPTPFTDLSPRNDEARPCVRRGWEPVNAPSRKGWFEKLPVCRCSEVEFNFGLRTLSHGPTNGARATGLAASRAPASPRVRNPLAFT
jgi:hypothetical protein